MKATLAHAHWVLFYCLSLFSLRVDSYVPPTPSGYNGIQSSTLTYQIHSYNDLREWNLVLRKGATWLKTDFYYMPYSFCKTQSQAAVDERGCFVLNHDTPISTREYNTSESLLNFVQDNSNLFFENPEKKIHIALCFKFDPYPCTSNELNTNWTSLITSFYDYANTLIDQYDLNLEFVLDGAATPGGTNPQRICLADLWPKWNATWIVSSDPVQGGFGDNSSLGYNRFQIMNPPSAPIIPPLYIFYMKDLDYGKFVHREYPYLFWEPSDQKTILEASDAYLGNGSLIHEPGFRFAINIDPVQLQVFVGSRSGSAWNYNTVTTLAKNPQIVAIGSNVLTTFNSLSNVQYQLSSFDGVLGDLKIGQPRNFTTKLDAISSLEYLDQNEVLFAGDLFGNFEIFSVNITSSTPFKSVYVGYLPLPAYSSSQIAITSQQNTIFIVQAISSNSDCYLQLQLWSLSGSNQPVSIGKAVCVQDVVEYLELSLDIEFQSSTSISGVLLFSDSSMNIYSYVFSVNSTNGDFILNQGVATKTPIMIDVGSRSSISLSSYNGTLFVLSTQTDSYCWNNEVDNKRPEPALCESIPTPTSYILTYTFAKYSDWVDNIISSAQRQSKGIINCCSENIFHGAFDSGSNSDVSLFVGTDKNGNQVLGLLEAHEGLPSNAIDIGGCGLSVPMEGLVLDSWNLSLWV
eukprot:TRINITY_DN2133_c0_g1_i3.p1 TRINITY_DN2133_c0_g1~~TRINITY_DN2133_c0_g1_i3.p1  ORF type:complete len:687 (+),score=107.61 TRINITY_DN2133_c0_g1_i3:1026-3086(+)